MKCIYCSPIFSTKWYEEIKTHGPYPTLIPHNNIKNLNHLEFEEKYENKELLEKFWDKISDYQFIVTYNGNTFDIPFIYFRSGINRVKIMKDIVGTRYNKSKHVDLKDELTFFGAHRSYKLDFVSQAFGITSPKEEGLDGSKVTEYFNIGRNEEIADYCLRDVKATYELYKVWDSFMRI